MKVIEEVLVHSPTLVTSTSIRSTPKARPVHAAKFVGVNTPEVLVAKEPPPCILKS